jgi:hypothetical protein
MQLHPSLTLALSHPLLLALSITCQIEEEATDEKKLTFRSNP